MPCTQYLVIWDCFKFSFCFLAFLLKKNEKIDIKEGEIKKEQKMIDYYSEGNANKPKRKVNKKKIIIVTCILLALILIGTVSALYITNTDFREFMDIYIFRKKIEENNMASIEIDEETNPSIFAYDKYVTVLDKSTLTLYNSSGKKEAELKVQISTPMYDTNGSYCVIAEKNGKKLYLIEGNNLVWEKEVEGEISRVSVNKNGYVSVVLTGTTHKTVIVSFTKEGIDLPTIFLSQTKAVDVVISNDNKYLAYAEVNALGSLIQSNIKILLLEKAQTDSETAVYYTYTAPENSLILKLKYTDKNALICMCDTGVISLQNQTQETLLELQEDKIIAMDIDLNGHIVRVEEIRDSLFKSSANIRIFNITTKKENVYKVDSVPKEIYTHHNTIAIHLGTEIHFISTNGWLIKKYISTQEVSDVVIGNSIAGVVYRDKVEVFGI